MLSVLHPAAVFLVEREAVAVVLLARDLFIVIVVGEILDLLLLAPAFSDPVGAGHLRNPHQVLPAALAFHEADDFAAVLQLADHLERSPSPKIITIDSRLGVRPFLVVLGRVRDLELLIGVAQLAATLGRES